MLCVDVTLNEHFHFSREFKCAEDEMMSINTMVNEILELQKVI